MLYSSELEFVTVWLIGGITGAISAVGFLLASALYYARKTRLGKARVSPKIYAPIHKNPVFKYRALRVLTCSAFLALTLVSFVRAQSTHPRQVAVASASIVYITCLSVLSAVPSPALSAMANRHANALLLSLFSVYAYRDIWPLFTFDKRSMDIDEGQILWLKVAALGIAAIAIPFACPNQAYPATMDQLNAETNPEEHASLLSLFTHSYLDSFIFRICYAKPLFTADELPPLAKADHSDMVMPRILSILDPPSGVKPDLFWGVVRAYRKSICTLACLNMLQFASSFIAPIGIKQILSYLENNNDGATVRPWVWVSCLILGPFLRAILSQMFTYMAGRNNKQISGVLNQLLLQHALKIRVESGHHSGQNREKSIFTGRLNNLAASDASELTGISDHWISSLCFPLELALCLWFLYAILGWSAIIGLAFMLLFLPVPGYTTRILRGIQVAKKHKTDARVQIVTDTLGILRTAKLSGWVARLESEIALLREEELSYAKKNQIYSVLNTHMNLLIPMFAMLITYAFYTAVFKKELSASIVFSSMAVFEMLRARVRAVVIHIPVIVQGNVALARIDSFLRKTELLDRYKGAQPAAPLDASEIGFRNAEFRWLDSGGHDFHLKLEGDVFFRRSCITLIVGQTGSGKTSLLLALLGEMIFSPICSGSYYHLPREGGISYSAQEPWIQNDTIRNNIIFGSEFDEERYNMVLYQCALFKDLGLFEAGDMTEVGEKGSTLSGGQKARVTLARAVYSSAQTVLLDDPFSALDVRTAKWVVEKCLKGPLVQGRTVLLVTHNIALTSSVAQNVLAIALDGRIIQGTVAEAFSQNSILTARLAEDEMRLNSSEQTEVSMNFTHREIVKPYHGGGLVLAEEMDVGHVGWKAFKLYLNGLGRHPIIFLWTVVLFIVLNDLNWSLQSWFLGYWASQYATRPASSVSVDWYLSVYGALMATSIALYSFGFIIWTFGALKASRVIHLRFINSIVSSTFRWLDTTPISRIITRATADMRNIDESFAFGVWRLTEATTSMVVKLGSILVFAPKFILPGIIIALLGGSIGQIYLTVQLPMRRLSSANKVPILGTFMATVADLISIRAYGAEEMFIQESKIRIDAWFRASLPVSSLDRWMAVRADVLAGLFTAGLATYLVYGNETISPANTGFSMNMAVGFTSLILTWVRLFNAVELEANSLERIQNYLDIEHEEEGSAEGKPPAYWPSNGSLRVENLRAKYSDDGPEVLHDLSFDVQPGEHIGIVGRTGSGKSSLTLALLRAIPTSGEVFYDGVRTRRLNLDALRSNITIIPQVPELLSGSLRSNLDPFSNYEESELNEALRSAGLFALQSEDVQRKLGLDTEVRAGGSNLSVGQRQIIALASAILRRSKLLVLDEATSSIDHETDAVIQETLRRELSDVTLITVAHRLATVIDFDRIMVLDEGKIVEFDSPKQLLENERGMFRALVDGSADRKKLYATVKEKAL